MLSTSMGIPWQYSRTSTVWSGKRIVFATKEEQKEEVRAHMAVLRGPPLPVVGMLKDPGANLHRPLLTR